MGVCPIIDPVLCQAVQLFSPGYLGFSLFLAEQIQASADILVGIRGKVIAVQEGSKRQHISVVFLGCLGNIGVIRNLHIAELQLQVGDLVVASLSDESCCRFFTAHSGISIGIVCHGNSVKSDINGSGLGSCTCCNFGYQQAIFLFSRFLIVSYP